MQRAWRPVRTPHVSSARGVGTGYPLLMGTPFSSEPHCLGEDSSQGRPGHRDQMTPGETEARTGEAEPSAARWAGLQGV